jgi:hypothetical protein
MTLLLKKNLPTSGEGLTKALPAQQQDSITNQEYPRIGPIVLKLDRSLDQSIRVLCSMDPAKVREKQ